MNSVVDSIVRCIGIAEYEAQITDEKARELERAVRAQFGPDAGITFAERVAQERRRQRDQWGDEHDDRHTLAEWSHILHMLSGKVAIEIEDRAGTAAFALPYPDRIKWRLVKLAATCQAAYEAIERGEAHGR